MGNGMILEKTWCWLQTVQSTYKWIKDETLTRWEMKMNWENMEVMKVEYDGSD